MTNAELDERLAVLVKHGVIEVHFGGANGDRPFLIKLASNVAPPIVLTPGDDQADLPPGPVDAAAIALAGRRRAERKSEAE